MGIIPRRGLAGLTAMSKTQEFSYLLVFIDTLTGWIEVFPTKTERATEVCKALLKEIVPMFGLPRSLQSDNGPSFTATISQNLAACSGIKYLLHSPWRPQALGKVERANQTLKRALAKLCQETHKWIHVLPIALMRVQTAPKRPLLLSPYKMMSILNFWFVFWWGRQYSLNTFNWPENVSTRTPMIWRTDPP